jgi:hypothetical protein
MDLTFDLALALLIYWVVEAEQNSLNQKVLVRLESPFADCSTYEPRTYFAPTAEKDNFDKRPGLGESWLSCLLRPALRAK